MADTNSSPKSFIEEAEALILANVEYENFGVSELADAMHMSRSNLLRKIKKRTGVSASQYIRQVRLKKAMSILEESSLTISEVSFRVGFASTSYFTKCFREYYGYPPGQVGKQVHVENNNEEASSIQRNTVSNQALGTSQELMPQEKMHLSVSIPWKWIIGGMAIIMACIVVYFMNSKEPVSSDFDKSLAVLPFKNESSDSTNAYFVNGLMESTLSKLQKINDLKVISRTTSEKYRQSQKSIPEIAEELEVSYVVEGSGQKVKEWVLLNIQLIEAEHDKPIWSQQYKRKFEDIFELQNEIAQEISIAIKAIVTPQELENIQKKPTDNLQAYDYYLQALDPYYSRTQEGLNEAIILFKKAIKEDEQFAIAYANIAISYYFLDRFQREKQFTKEINRYADKALLYDSKSDICLISKALYYIENREYRLALPHLNKAVEFNPNSALGYRMLADFYAYYEPNTKKYLLNAMQGVQLDASGGDSTVVSYGYLQLSNALVQAGFFDEALKYVDLSLDYDAYNKFAPHLKIFVRFAKDQNWERTERLLTDLWKKDTSRIDILQDLAKIYYGQEKYDSAYHYYDKFVRVREANKLNSYIQENVKIAQVYKLMGKQQKADSLFADYITYADELKSPYRSATIAFKHAYLEEKDETLKQLKKFSEQKNIQYWFLLMQNDPLLKPFKKDPEFEATMRLIERSFWDDHAQLQNELIDKGVL